MGHWTWAWFRNPYVGPDVFGMLSGPHPIIPTSYPWTLEDLLKQLALEAYESMEKAWWEMDVSDIMFPFVAPNELPPVVAVFISGNSLYCASSLKSTLPAQPVQPQDHSQSVAWLTDQAYRRSNVSHCTGESCAEIAVLDFAARKPVAADQPPSIQLMIAHNGTGSQPGIVSPCFAADDSAWGCRDLLRLARIPYVYPSWDGYQWTTNPPELKFSDG